MKQLNLSLFFSLLTLSLLAQEKLEHINYDIIFDQVQNLTEDATDDERFKLLNKINPNDSVFDDIQITKSYYKIKSKKYDEALSIINESFKSKSAIRLSLFVNKGVCYREKDSFNLAIKAYNDGLKEFPNNYELYYYRGVTHEKNGDLKKAYDDYIKSISLLSLIHI